MADAQVKQMRDFLTVYNTVSETCFNNCVNTFADRLTTDNEVSCIEKCVTKYLGLNHKVMEVFVQLQPEILQKKMEEIEKLSNTASDEAQESPDSQISANS